MENNQSGVSGAEVPSFVMPPIPEGMESPLVSEQTLANKLAEARRLSEAKAETGLNKVEGKRTEFGEVIERAKETAKSKIKEFRTWDREHSIKFLGGAGALPEMSKIVAKEGVSRVVEGGKKTLNWIEDSGRRIGRFFVDTEERAEEAVNTGIDNVTQKFVETGNDITDFFEETGEKVDEGVEKGKNSLIKAWKRVLAVPVDISIMRHERNLRVSEQIAREERQYRKEVRAKLEDRRAKSETLKGTRLELARALS